MDVVLLLSGGLDSYIAYYYALDKGYNVIPIWFNINQPYANKEREALDSLSIDYHTIKLNLIDKKWDNIPDIDNQIIDGRNMIFATIAASYGTHIWMCALKGEMHDYMVDKNERFFHLASETLSYTFNKNITVETPFSTMTKADIVRWGKSRIPVNLLLQTSTCYDSKVRNCGKCSTCLKRKIAFILNDIQEDYIVDPFKTEDGVRYKSLMEKALEDKDYSHYSQYRILETLEAYALNGIQNTTRI